MNDPDEDLATDTNPDVLIVIYTSFDSSETWKYFFNQEQSEVEIGNEYF